MLAAIRAVLSGMVATIAKDHAGPFLASQNISPAPGGLKCIGSRTLVNAARLPDETLKQESFRESHRKFQGRVVEAKNSPGSTLP